MIDQDAKNKIHEMLNQIMALESKIVVEANRVLKERDIKLPFTTPDGEKFPNVLRSTTLFQISNDYDCPESPFGWCMYDLFLNKDIENNCVFCNQSKDREPARLLGR